MEMTQKFYLGSVIRGTEDIDELLEVFAEQLGASHPLVIECNGMLDQDIADYGAVLADDMMNALNEQSPPFTYFGPNDEDEHDYGFWLSPEGLEYALKNGERNEDGYIYLPDDECPDNSIWAYFDGHGNVTVLDDDNGKPGPVYREIIGNILRLSRTSGERG
jgi:hypothetical protein